MWYVIRTETGREEQVMEEIFKLIPRDRFKTCFAMKRENLCHSRGECKIVVERMFPGYLFLITDNPEYFYSQLKKIPHYAKVLGREEEVFFPIREEEKVFLQSLIDEESGDYLVKLSPVTVDKNGEFLQVGGALRQYRKYIVRKRNRLRYALIKVELFGQEREIYLGIRMEGDLGESRKEFLKLFQSNANDKEIIQIPEDAGKEFAESTYKNKDIYPGAYVCVTDGSFAGSVGLVVDINESKRTIVIETEMFHRKQSVQLDWETGLVPVEREIENV